MLVDDHVSEKQTNEQHISRWRRCRTDSSHSACGFPLFMLDELLTSLPSSQPPLVDLRTSSMCLITKDPQREYNDLKRHGISFISRDQSLRGGETQRQIQGNCCSRKTRCFSWTNGWYLSSRVEAEKVFSAWSV